ncbi:MAG: TatD family hydrolase [Syntrophobacteraceae bacterium]
MEKTPELIDTHAHLDFPEFIDDIPSTLARAKQAGVGTVITIGIDIESSLRAASLAEKYEPILATAGIHPHGAFVPDEASLAELEKILLKPRVVAVGEIGLDYFRDKKPRTVQQECMRRQIELACSVAKPAVFHIRNAWEDFFRIVPDYAPKLSGAVMHCFSGDWKTAVRCLDMGFFLSIPGVVTFPKAGDLREAALRAPLDRLLVETDAPYLTPVPHRGKTNEPAYVRHTAEMIAHIRKEPLDIIAAHTTRNARAVFRI